MLKVVLRQESVRIVGQYPRAMNNPPIVVISLANVLTSSHGVEKALERASWFLDQAAARHEDASVELWQAVIEEIRRRVG